MVFVIDRSGSIGVGNFQQIRRFVANITTELFRNSISPPAVGVIVFSNEAAIEFELQSHSDLSSLLSDIENIRYPGGNTNTSGALSLLLSTAQDGRLRLRSNSLKVAIVITDGGSNNPVATEIAATMLHASNIFNVVYAVGIARAIRTELQLIASDPRFVLFTESFSNADLQQLQENILPQLCIRKLHEMYCRSVWHYIDTYKVNNIFLVLLLCNFCQATYVCILINK